MAVLHQVTLTPTKTELAADWLPRQPWFDAPVEALPCWGGTGANVVGLATVLQPWEAVVCADCAHVVVDEAGALNRFAGVSVLPVPHDEGRLGPDAIVPYLQWLGSEHHPQPRAVSITQATEYGAIYTPDEIGALAEAAHAAGLLVHLDGARIANALVATGTDLPTMVRDSRTNRSVMPPAFIRFAVSRKNGTASRMNEL